MSYLKALDDLIAATEKKVVLLKKHRRGLIQQGHGQLHNGVGVTVIDEGITKGKQGVVEKWDPDVGKWKVGFDGSWCGWYLDEELSCF